VTTRMTASALTLLPQALMIRLGPGDRICSCRRGHLEEFLSRHDRRPSRSVAAYVERRMTVVVARCLLGCRGTARHLAARPGTGIGGGDLTYGNATGPAVL
jgi:hypothetical protein